MHDWNNRRCTTDPMIWETAKLHRRTPPLLSHLHIVYHQRCPRSHHEHIPLQSWVQHPRDHRGDLTVDVQEHDLHCTSCGWPRSSVVRRLLIVSDSMMVHDRVITGRDMDTGILDYHSPSTPILHLDPASKTLRFTNQQSKPRWSFEWLKGRWNLHLTRGSLSCRKQNPLK